jgi:DNA-binding winged helix-turn-helix (wHTH) protein
MRFSQGTAHVTFGACVLDVQTRELKAQGKTVALSPKLFRLLTVLLDHRPRAISKRELHERIWAETFVSDATLATLVADLRRAIGDVGECGNLIRTVHGFGYAFSGDASVVSAVAAPEAGPICYLLGGDSEVALSTGEHTVGRIRHSTVWIDDPAVSRRHARITVAPDGVTLQDLGSKNGTYLNARRLQTVETLNDGDEIVIGPAHMRYRVLSGEQSTVTRLRRAM